jgi:hypothetical protein
MARVVGIVALFVLTACSQSNANVGPSPSPILPQGNWTQNLAFAGELTGQMSGIVPDTTDQQSECTGSRTHTGDTWSDGFYGTIDTSGEQWHVIFLLDNFRGPGTYVNNDAIVQVESTDFTQAWLNLDADKVTFTVDRSQQSGSVDAQLTDATSGKGAAVHLTGTWNCRG